MPPRLAPCLQALVVWLVLVGLPGCGAAGGPFSALRRAPSLAASRGSSPDGALVRALALRAHAALSALDVTYAELKLNTPGGRRFTPEQEVRVREGLLPAIVRLDEATGLIAARLRQDAHTGQVRAFAGRFEALTPRTGPDAAPEPTATALLFRVSQLRVQLGAVIDFAIEQGWLTELPARPAADRAQIATGS
ncbi:MAG: hypothetical protein VKQ33_09915 [Candidatus Sericytochromatia bacterium]|nr:hypothetical protein [Candidatus Sericytochromatia bacterium]